MNISKERLLEYAILLFGLFPLLPNRLKGLPVIFLFLVGLLFLHKGSLNWKWFFINSSLFLTYIISVMLINGEGSYGQIIETTLSGIALPITFHLCLKRDAINDNVVKNFYKVFIISSVLFGFIVSITTFFDTTTVYYSDWYTNKARTVMENLPVIGQHPIYGSLFFALSLIFSWDLLRKGINKTKNIILSLLNLSFLLFFLSKGVVISLFIALAISFFYAARFTKKNIAIFLSGAILFSSLFFFNRRMREMLSFKTYEKVDVNYSNSLRIGIYTCVFEILQDKYLLGVGLGETQAVLNNCYASKSDVLLQKTYNSHNQFFDIWLKTGLFGMFIFIFFLLANIIKSFRSRNRLSFSILLFFTVLLFVENIISRQTGAILFYFLITFINVKNSKFDN